ncbi:class I SAM-dependent methyltransferase [Brevibacterium sp. UCMA 11754]|uniref:class I SAM-dependent methyltransferase n=1 Tax=Brevibacterium sp. UCMA 11754 TaxID=2749198 RepID=UPI001F48DC3D|nr:class I SAM-dependent methyltransferase [Brevibacterium sp. UCMA 11754]MCF2574323.1 methyltransferase domain-containing protein [Brevibacterium sp. UCMA 11754]
MRPRAQAAHGRDFGQLAGVYDEVRPRYPDAAINLVSREWSTLEICDLGAGTGILSSALLDRGANVIAIDPDEVALANNPARSLVGSAEDTGLPDACVDIVTVAQAWHWFDEAAAATEIKRILRPHGHLIILINQLDVRRDWVLRLSRIMHAGDVYRPAYRPSPAGFDLIDHELVEFTTPLSFRGIVDLARTRSYWLRSNQTTRSRVESNLREYFSVERPFDGELDLPYMCLAYVLRSHG